MTELSPRPRRRRWLTVLIAVVAVVIYAVVVLLYAAGLRSTSNGCETVIEGDDGVTVLLQPAAVHAVEQRLQFQVTLDPSKNFLSVDGYTAKQGISLLTFPVDGSLVQSFAEGEALASATQSDYAAGVVEEWPFDSYEADLTTYAFTGSGAAELGLPTKVCLDDSVPGWQFEIHQIGDSDNFVETAAGEVELPTVVITATRSASTVAFGIVLLGLMAVVPVLVLFVAISAYTGRRKVEATLTSWIGAMIFATIPLRNFLPGSPPVGSWIDYLVVLWVIVGLVTGLTIYILAWNRWGTRASPRSPHDAEQPQH